MRLSDLFIYFLPSWEKALMDPCLCCLCSGWFPCWVDWQEDLKARCWACQIQGSDEKDERWALKGEMAFLKELGAQNVLHHSRWMFTWFTAHLNTIYLWVWVLMYNPQDKGEAWGPENFNAQVGRYSRYSCWFYSETKMKLEQLNWKTFEFVKLQVIKMKYLCFW